MTLDLSPCQTERKALMEQSETGMIRLWRVQIIPYVHVLIIQLISYKQESLW
ncbi:hypothetical protein D3C85_1889430 [compost metagenome]